LVEIGAIGLIITLSLAFIIFQTKASKEGRIISLLILLGMLISVVSVTLALGGCRYILPFHTGIMVILVFMLLRSKQIKNWMRNIALVALISISALTTTGYEELQVYWHATEANDLETTKELVNELKTRNFKHGFVTDWQICWQLNYLCYDQIDFRTTSNVDRVQRMIDRANACYLDNDCRIAAVGGYWPYSELNNSNAGTESEARINSRYFVLENPSDSVLQILGFQLPTKEGN
jgi:hypothetical protein